MHATQIIKRPLISEKSYWEKEKFGRYSFVVDMNATKEQVARAVRELYDVRVAKVRMQIRKGEIFRTKYGESKRPNFKKAIVQLHAEDQIESFA